MAVNVSRQGHLLPSVRLTAVNAWERPFCCRAAEYAYLCIVERHEREHNTSSERLSAAAKDCWRCRSCYQHKLNF